MTRLVTAAMDRPGTAIAIAVLLTLAFLIPFPSVVIDTDPENMLEPDQTDRAFYTQVKEDFGIYDLIVVGVTDTRGIFRPDTLARLDRIAEDLVALDGVVVEDVLSLSTSDNVTADGDTFRVARIMDGPPATEAEATVMREAVLGNAMFREKLVSLDGTGVAFYVPIERKDQSHAIAAEIEHILARELDAGHQRAYIAGLPVAEDTFGYEMFVQMAITAPLAMGVIFLLMLLMFRKASLVVPPMAVAMMSVVWAMGALVGLGFTVHIMSSMIPVFLMPIAVLDSVHVLSEFYDRYPQIGDRRRTIRTVMQELYSPMLYTSLTSAAGFASLMLAPIPPVRVFGAFVAMGILAAWVLTITLIPASIVLTREDTLRARVGARPAGRSLGERGLSAFGRLAFASGGRVIMGAAILLAVGAAGLGRIVVNDNPVKWFKSRHPIRVADAAMNRLFGGTYMADLIVEGGAGDAIKRPEVMAFIDRLQRHLEEHALVGKTTSVVDVVKRVNYVVHGEQAAHDAVPSTQEEVGQYLFLFLSSGDPNDLDNVVDYDYRRANIWVQMKRGDNQDVATLERVVAAFIRDHPPPEGIELRWSGLTYINKVWQDLMVTGMRNAILGGFVTVFVLMLILFRSFRLALISMLPLTFSIILSYGALGWVGKDYDMPVAVCSSLALGLSIDFAIHFVQRFRRKYADIGDLGQVNAYMFTEPARAIARNAVVIVVGFLPLVLATLTPYVTVGVFFAALMAISAVTTLLLLPAVMRFAGPALGRPLRAI